MEDMGRGAAPYTTVGIIAWDVDNLWIRLFDDDDLLGFHYFRFYLLLLIRFQVARALRFLAHTLHSVHDIILLTPEMRYLSLSSTGCHPSGA